MALELAREVHPARWGHQAGGRQPALPRHPAGDGGRPAFRDLRRRGVGGGELRPMSTTLANPNVAIGPPPVVPPASPATARARSLGAQLLGAELITPEELEEALR